MSEPRPDEDPPVTGPTAAARGGIPPVLGFAIVGVTVGLIAALVIPLLTGSPAKGNGGTPSLASGSAQPVASSAGPFQRVGVLHFSATVEALAFNPDGSRLAVMTRSSQTTVVQVMDTSSWHVGSHITEAGADFLAYSPDGRRLVTDTRSGAQLWDPAAGSPAGELLSGSEVAGHGPVAFSPDGTTAAHAESVSVQPGAPITEELRFWDTRTLATTRALTFAGNGQVETLAYSPDGSLVAVGGEDLTSAGGSAQVALVDPARVKVARMLVTTFPAADESLSERFTSLAFNPDGRTLAVATAHNGSGGSGVRLWDPASGRLLATLTTGGGGTVAYSPDGRLLSFGTADGDVVEVLDLARRTQVAALQLGQSPDGTPSYSGGQQFDPNGRLLAVPVGSTVQLWSIPGGTTPRPSMSGSLPVASGAGVGAQCGAVGTSPSGGTLELIIRSGSATCAQALTVLHDYRASKDRQGSGGFATVDGWTCGHNSFAGFQQSGEYESCQRGNDGLVTHGR